MRHFPCDYCNAPAELIFCRSCSPETESVKLLKIQIKNLKDELDDKNKLIERMSQTLKEKDGVYNALKDVYRKDKSLETEQQYFIKEDNLLRLSDYLDCFMNEEVYQFTITFDPSFFKCRLINEYTQREYIRTILWATIKKYELKDMVGSFELHKSGITHAHVILNVDQKISKEITNYLSTFLTRRDIKDQRAVRADHKDTQEAFNYVTKEVTKSTAFDNNFFYYKSKLKNLNL